jgi:hypothetical protein
LTTTPLYLRRHLGCCGRTVEARYPSHQPEKRIQAERDLEVLVKFHPCKAKDDE